MTRRYITYANVPTLIFVLSDCAENTQSVRITHNYIFDAFV